VTTVLLVNTNLMKPAVSPIGLDYLASALGNKGYQVDLLDLCFAADFRKPIDDYFKKNSPVVVGITVRNTDDCYFQSGDFFLPQIKQITNHLKLKTNAPLVLGGVGFSIMPEQILSYCGINLGIRGDGEGTFVRLVEKIISGEVITSEDYADLPGLVWVNKGKYQSNPPQFIDLDEIILPNRDFVDNRRYFKEGGQGGIETKRGCNQRCIYCADPVAKGKKIRLRSPKKVVAEIKNLLNQGIDCFHTCDSEFNLPEEHAKAVCREIIGQKINTKIKWYAYCSPAPFSDELAKLMKKAGCAGIDFGVDSGSPKILKILKRNFGVEEIKNTAKLCHQYGITFMYDLLLGGPGETRETVRETIKLMKRVSPDRIGVMLGVRVYPGTELARRMGRLEGEKDKKGYQGEKQGLYGNKGRLIGDLPKRQGDSFLSPTFYLSPELGRDIDRYILDLIAGDERFFFSARKDSQNYNYNQNQILIRALKEGYKGAYWDILRRWSTT